MYVWYVCMYVCIYVCMCFYDEAYVRVCLSVCLCECEKLNRWIDIWLAATAGRADGINVPHLVNPLLRNCPSPSLTANTPPHLLNVPHQQSLQTALLSSVVARAMPVTNPPCVHPSFGDGKQLREHKTKALD